MTDNAKAAKARPMDYEEYYGIDRHAVAARLKQARSRIFPTAADAARALGMKPVTVRAHESGQNGVDVFDLERYARRYGCDIGWLLKGGDDSRPKPEFHVEHGETIPITGLIQDGVWLEDDPESPTYPIQAISPPTHGGFEFTTYADPRFPSAVIQAWRISTKLTDGPYVDGAIVFCVPMGVIGYKAGDHLVIALDDQNKGMVQWTLRKVVRTEDDIVYAPILSEGEPLKYMDGRDGVLTSIQGIVIGSLQRRSINELSIEDRRHIEGFERVTWYDLPKKGNHKELEFAQWLAVQKALDALEEQKDS